MLNFQQAREHIKKLKNQVQIIENHLDQPQDKYQTFNNDIQNKNISTNSNINKNTQNINPNHTNIIDTNEINLKQYINNALYSLVKNDQELSSKVNDYKANKLPSIYDRTSGLQKQAQFTINNGKYRHSNYSNNNVLNNFNHTNNKDQSSSSALKSKRTSTLQNKTKANSKQSQTKNKINSFSTKADQSLSIDNNNKNDHSFVVQNRQIKIYSFQQKHKPIEINSENKLGSILQYDNVPIPSHIKHNRQQESSHSSIRNRKYEHKLKLINFNNESTLNNPLNSNNNISILSNSGNYEKNQLTRNKQQLSKQTFTKKQQDDTLLKYDTVVDNFSNHFFMVIRGKTAVESPQYASYQRIYKSIFHKIQHQIKQLQKLLIFYSINFAKFDGKKLAYLCLKQTIKRQQLIQCLVDGRQEILALIPQTKYKGKQGKIKAANKIIAYWKMVTTKRKYLILKQKTKILQDFFRRQHLRLKLENNIIKRNTSIGQRFEQRQSNFQQNYKEIMQKKRIQIHLNSIQCDEQKRLTIQNFDERQNIQLTRIFRLKDENVIIVYVSAREIPHQVINYYYKILQLSDVKNYKDRLFFISPLQYKIMPEHLSVSKQLYYCSSTLKQLKNITQGTTAILYPGSPSNQLLKITDFLECYLYSGEPSKMKQFLSKSQTKRLLKNLCIQTLPGSMEMYDYGQFLNTFSVLIVKNPQISTWVLKIDDEFQGRGIAYIQLGKSKLISSLLKKVQYHQSSEVFATDLVSEPTNQQITIKIRDYLKQKLPNKLVIVTQTLYRNYEEYIGSFIKKGGIIEAHPPCSRQLLTFPSVAFCLLPDGQVKIISSFQKILSQPFKSIACQFPQNSLDYEEITSLCRQLTESFKIRKLYGYFTIDLISYKKDEQRKFWVIGIEPYLNNYASSFYLFEALMQGKYIAEKGTYLTEIYPNETFQKDNHTVRSSVQSVTRSQQKSTNKSLTSIQSQSKLANRTYLFIPHFLNKNFCKINIKQFFKQARIEQFNFDIAQKYGICMLLFDELTSGELGLMAVSESKEEGIDKLKKVLEFISRITNLKSSSVYGKSELQPSTDAIQVNEVISKFLTMQRKQRRKDAKKKAIEKHKNKQDLDLII